MRATSELRLAPVTPWDRGAPAIHGPRVHGASAGAPFLYAIPATGERPLRFAAEGLPEGLQLGAATGHLAGSLRSEGESRVLLRAENRHGKAEWELTIACGRGLALTPPMGWNSWNAWRRWVDDGKVRSAAEQLVSTGLAARGYSYVNLDSCWQGVRGGAHGAIQPNRKFPDMRALADHVHGLGLKFGIYSTPWTVPWGCTPEEAEQDWGGPGLIGCSSGDPDPDYEPQSMSEGRYVGITKHEAQDVAQWVEWGVDLLKYDWSITDAMSLARMGRALRDVPRDIVLSICTGARLAEAEAMEIWANMWRGIADTHDDWTNVLQNAFGWEDGTAEDWRRHVSPGSWSDLDMLALGPQFKTASTCCPNRMSEDEQIACMTAWALFPSPLILSCDLAALTDFELRLFGNEEVIAVNQDPLGKPVVPYPVTWRGCPAPGGGDHDVRAWVRPLEGGTTAVGLFNLGESAGELELDLAGVGIDRPVRARNLWERRDIGRVHDRLSVPVPAHGAQLVLLAP